MYTPINKAGDGWQDNLNCKYDDIVRILGEPNVTGDDPVKVQASWGALDEEGERVGVWSYKDWRKLDKIDSWSVWAETPEALARLKLAYEVYKKTNEK